MGLFATEPTLFEQFRFQCQMSFKLFLYFVLVSSVFKEPSKHTSVLNRLSGARNGPHELLPSGLLLDHLLLAQRS